MLDSLANPVPDPNSFVSSCVGVGRTQTLPSSSNKKGGEKGGGLRRIMTIMTGVAARLGDDGDEDNG